MPYALDIIHRIAMDNYNIVKPLPVSDLNFLYMLADPSIILPNTVASFVLCSTYLSLDMISHMSQHTCLFTHAHKSAYFNLFEWIILYVKGTIDNVMYIAPSQIILSSFLLMLIGAIPNTRRYTLGL
jgi:hypothetical protein